MPLSSALQYVAFLLILIALWKPAGGYMARVFEGERTGFDAILGPLERAIYRLTGVDPQLEMSAREYAASPYRSSS